MSSQRSSSAASASASGRTSSAHPEVGQGPTVQFVVRSLITLKALTYMPTGGIVAAATTSLPEQLGGVRNWDYRYCWVRDATLTLYALMAAGYQDEARAWRAPGIASRNRSTIMAHIWPARPTVAGLPSRWATAW